MNKITIEELRQQPDVDRIVILSLNPSLYTARAFLDGEEYLVMEGDATITRPSVEGVKWAFAGCKVGEYRLRHDSAYEEMIGLEPGNSRVLDVPTSGPETDSDIA